MAHIDPVQDDFPSIPLQVLTDAVDSPPSEALCDPCGVSRAVLVLRFYRLDGPPEAVRYCLPCSQMALPSMVAMSQHIKRLGSVVTVSAV